MKFFARAFIILWVIALCCWSNTGFAGEIAPKLSSSQGIGIQATENAACSEITGTWQGMVWDSGGLFGDGGPFNIQADLYMNEPSAQVVGKLRAQGLVKSALSKPIWAQCQNGVLHAIFVGEKGHCGALSEGGILATKNLLIVPIHYENSMADTHLIMILQRVNSQYQGMIPQQTPGFELGSVESCH